MNDSKEHAQTFDNETEYVFGTVQESQAVQSSQFGSETINALKLAGYFETAKLDGVPTAAWRKTSFDKTGTLVVTLSFDEGSDYNIEVYNSCSGKNFCSLHEFGRFKTCTMNIRPGEYYFKIIQKNGEGKYYLDADLIEEKQLSSANAWECDTNPLLSCPENPIGEDYSFQWSKGKFEYSHLQISYYPDFLKKTNANAKTASNLNIAKYYKRLIGYEARSTDKTLYARIYAKNSQEKTAYSNVCPFKLKQPVAPTLECPQTAISSDYAFYWLPGDYNKIAYLQFSHDENFEHRTRIYATKTNPVPIASQWKTIQSFSEKNPEKKVFARIFARDKYNRKTYSNNCNFPIDENNSLSEKAESITISLLPAKAASNPFFIGKQKSILSFADYTQQTLDDAEIAKAEKFFTKDREWFRKFVKKIRVIDENNFEIEWLGDSAAWIGYAITEMEKTRPAQTKTNEQSIAFFEGTTFVSSSPGCEAYYQTDSQGKYVYCDKICGTTSYRCSSTGDTVYNRNQFISTVAYMCDSCTFKQTITNEYIQRCPGPTCVNNYNYYNRHIPGTTSWQGYYWCQILTGTQNCCSYDSMNYGCNTQTCTNDCSSGQRACSNSTQYWYCGEAGDGDNCLDRIISNCYSGQSCSNGYCTTPSCSSGWKCIDSSNKAYQYSDCTWGNQTYCDYGCSNDSCNSAPSCSSHFSSSCYTGNLYWFNSCGNREEIKQDCGNSYCDSWGASYCKNGSTYHSRTCYDKGCSGSSCTTSTRTEEEIVQSCSQGCSNGACLSGPQPGDTDYCTPENPCEFGEGNCNDNRDCLPGLRCAEADGLRFGFQDTVNVCEGVSVKNGSFSCYANGYFLEKSANPKEIIYFSDEKTLTAKFFWPVVVETVPSLIEYVLLPACEKASENAGKIILGTLILIGGTILTGVTQNENEINFEYERLSTSNGEFYYDPNNSNSGFDYHYNKHVVVQEEYKNLILYPPGSRESEDAYKEICKDSANKEIGIVRKFRRPSDGSIITWDPSIEQVVFQNKDGKITSCFIPDSTINNPRFKYIQEMIDAKKILEILPK